MKRICKSALAISAAMLLTALSHAQVSLNSVRIAAKDSVALAKFYEAAFGMQEVNRIESPGGPEVFVNFGSTVESAKANKSEPIVIMHRESDDVKDPIAHVILNVKDMPATVAAIKAAGGSMTGDPRPFGNTGIIIGIAIDPAGNRIEMIHRP
jgi:predicted enzyme related to lactoylglutathione lyase